MHPFVRCLPLLACAAFGPLAHAASYTVHVCEDGRGARSYQDSPCARETSVVGTRVYAIATPDPALAARTRATEAEMDRRNHAAGRMRIVRTGSVRRNAAPDPCKAAKDRRETELKRVGLKRTFDLLSRLDGDVWDACKGF